MRNRKARPLVRLFLVAHRFVRFMYWTVTQIHAFSQGVWLGLLKQQHLLDAMEVYYRWDDSFTKREYNLAGLKQWEKVAVDRFFNGCQTLLVTGAGGGREVIALSRQGFNVTGYEPNAELVEHANGLLEQAGFASRLTVVPYGEMPEVTEQFDGAIVGWGAYTHIQGSTNRIKFLKQLSGHVRIDGPVVVSFLTRKSYDESRLKVTIGVANLIRLLLRRPYLEEGDAFEEMAYVHVFEKSEILAEIEAAGYEQLFVSEEPYAHSVIRNRG